MKSSSYGTVVGFVFLSTQENDIDLGSGGTGHRQIFMTSNGHIPIQNTLGRSQLCLVPVVVENYCRAGQATDKNMAHSHCIL